jgi:hypothetical protein
MDYEAHLQPLFYKISLGEYRLVRGMGHCMIMQSIQSPLDVILNEIDRALEQKFYYLAVSTVLTLPDLCVSLLSGRSSGPLYKNWCKENLGPEFDYLTGDDLYSFRCGVIHNGRFGDLKHSVGRVLFVFPFRGNQFVNCMIDDAYFYSVEDFCRNFISYVRKWYDQHKDNPELQANLNRMVQYRPEGLAPYSIGAPLLG